jgi:CBS domain containing-hemolysin-like protein
MEALIAAFSDPALWVGLLTLITLEVVLGIDNLLFIAVLAEKLPLDQRDAARRVGLALALIMRLVLLTAMSWMVTLTQPIGTLLSYPFSGRDLILIGGGLFLVFKATVELDERLEGRIHAGPAKRVYAGFWMVIAQIVILDAVFSLDAVITAVGMVDELWVMMTAVVIAMAIMMAASRPLTAFVGKHPTLVILCLGFLLMIGFSLIADGFGFDIPKGYLYAAIGFSVLVETFNQVARRNTERQQARTPLRERTADAILRLMGARTEEEPVTAPEATAESEEEEQVFREEERFMITGVLSLADRTVKRIMTPRIDITWINTLAPPDRIRAQVRNAPHATFPVCQGDLDDVLGVLSAAEIFSILESGGDLAARAALHPPVKVPSDLDAIQVVEGLRSSRGRLVFATAGDGSIEGLVTPLDVLEAIAGEFPDADEVPDILPQGDGWIVKGSVDLYQLAHTFAIPDFPRGEDETWTTLAGLLVAQNDSIPAIGDSFQINGLGFEVLAATYTRVEQVRIWRLPPESARG